MTDESVCPTLVRKSLRPGGAGAFPCQPILSRLPRAAARSRLLHSLDLYGSHDDFLHRPVLRPARHVRDLLDHLVSFGHFAENAVLVVRSEEHTSELQS